MRMIQVRTSRIAGRQLVEDELFCDPCWAEMQKLPCYNTDEKYEVKVIIVNSERKCQECHNEQA